MELAAEGFINRCIGNAPSHICIYMLYSVTFTLFVLKILYLMR